MTNELEIYKYHLFEIMPKLSEIKSKSKSSQFLLTHKQMTPAVN